MERALIVEDDYIQLEALRLAMKSVYPQTEVVAVRDVSEALNQIRDSICGENYFSVFLLDIQLGEDSSNRGGFIIANNLRTNSCYYRTPILFLTSIQSDMNIGLNHYHCYSYITKPYTIECVTEALNQMAITGFLHEQTLIVTNIDRIQFRVRMENLILVHAKFHVLNLLTTLGTIHTRDYSLKTIQDSLTGDFVRCHKSYLINIKYVKNYDKTNHFVWWGDEIVPVSRTYAKQLEQRLEFV